MKYQFIARLLAISMAVSACLPYASVTVQAAEADAVIEGSVEMDSGDGDDAGNNSAIEIPASILEESAAIMEEALQDVTDTDVEDESLDVGETIDDTGVADEGEVVTVYGTTEGLDQDVLYDAYVERLFADGDEDSVESHGAARRDQLDFLQKQIYDDLKKWVTRVASGEVAYTGHKITLGSDQMKTFEEGMSKQSGYDSQIVDALVYDMPYEFYWYSGDYRLERQYTWMKFVFEVAPDYCDASYNDPFSQVDQDMIAAARTAAANAKAIAQNASGKSLYDALQYFKQEICTRVEYNAEYENAYGGVGQSLVAVFDNLASTNPSSYGYARAFQYLCQQWGIQSHKADCYIVKGTTSDLNGANKTSWYWNIVETEYGSYVVDLTNCDSGRCGYPDLLFLQAPSAITGDNKETWGYTFSKAGIRYELDATIVQQTYTNSEIGISGNSYQTDLAGGIAKDYTGWQTVNGKSYWYENGVKQGTTDRGKEIYDPNSQAWYWLDAVQGGAKAVSKDVYQESNGGKWVRYDADGHMVKGWQTTSAGTYYFDLITGAMAKGKVTIDGLPCWFDENTGVGKNLVWEQVNGQDYYWYENGKRQGYDPGDKSYRGKEIYDPAQNAWFWLDNNAQGKKAVSKDVYQPYTYQGKDTIGKWVRYDATGRMIKGWQTTSAGRYYFDLTTGAMAKGPVKVSGKYYYFQYQTGILQSGSYAERMTYAAQVVDIVNQERAKEGRAALRISPGAMEAAMVRAQEIATSFSHVRPNGKMGQTALREYGVDSMPQGENIASGHSTPSAVMTGWMHSDGHRANILQESYAVIGVGYYVSGGRASWVQLFAGE